MTQSRLCRVLVGVLGVVVVFAIFTGCARLKNMGTDSSQEPEAEAIKGPDTPEPLYYDFEDVLVPLELKVEKEKSFVYSAPGFKAGIVSLSGRVEMESLISFFENNMTKDNWRLVSQFKSPRTLMFFNKPNRSCIISITEGKFSTDVEIWVAPTLEEKEATLLK